MNIPSWLLTGAVVVFVVSSMLSIGLVAKVAELAAPLRRPAWVVRALAANFVVPPMVALALSALLPLDPAYELGLMLMAFAAGAPFLPKLAEVGGANVAVATALMVLLMACSVVAMPLALPWLAPGLKVDPWRIAQRAMSFRLISRKRTPQRSVFARSVRFPPLFVCSGAEPKEASNEIRTTSFRSSRTHAHRDRVFRVGASRLHLDPIRLSGLHANAGI